MGLEAIRKRCKPSWSINHVHAHLLDARATAFVCDEGFVVLQRCGEAITGFPYLNVWLMWFQPGRAKARDAEIVAWLDEMKKRWGCMYWEFNSPRDEWAGAIAPFCEKVMTTWRRK